MKFCHIAPTELVSIAASHSSCFLTLAHLIEKDSNYIEAYTTAYETAGNRKKDIVRIMDNSAFEYYKEHGPGYIFDPSKLIDLATKIDAEYIVLPDYPGEQASKTIDAATEFAKLFKTHNIGTFFVPQSKPGDLEDYIQAVKWAANSNLIDYIGISILGAPVAYNVEQNNKLQRYCSRLAIMNELKSRGIIDTIKKYGKKIHFLGMVDGPNEIELVEKFWDCIDSWDSSSAVWAAIMGKRYDNTPTGLVNGKIETAVDFDYKISTITSSILGDMMYNINFINDKVLRAHNFKERARLLHGY